MGGSNVIPGLGPHRGDLQKLQESTSSDESCDDDTSQPGVEESSKPGVEEDSQPDVEEDSQPYVEELESDAGSDVVEDHRRLRRASEDRRASCTNSEEEEGESGEESERGMREGQT